MNNENIFLASNIQHLRQLQKSTQKQVGIACGRSDTTISNWETGIREPDAISLKRLSDFFQVPIDDLVGTNLKIRKPLEMKISKIHFLLNQYSNQVSEKDIDYILYILERSI